MQCFRQALGNQAWEVVIFDAPALLGLPDATILASKVDGTLVVVDISRARKKDLKQVKALLGQARARVLGCVVNKGALSAQGHALHEHALFVRLWLWKAGR